MRPNSLIACAYALGLANVLAFTPTGSFVAYYKNEIGGYTISAGLAFYYDKCAALLDTLTETGVVNQVLQDFSAVAKDKIATHIAASNILQGGGNAWTPTYNHFGVITNHRIINQSNNIMVRAAAYALASAYGLSSSAVHDSAPGKRRGENSTSGFDILEDVLVFTRDPGTVLSELDVKWILRHSIADDLDSVNDTIAADSGKRNEQYCATYNGVSYKCIDWSHNVESGGYDCSYNCGTGKAFAGPPGVCYY